MTSESPDEVHQRRWDEAYRRADAIGDFLRQRSAGSTAEDIAGLAAKLGLNQATTYRLIKIFQEGGTVTSLLRSLAQADATAVNLRISAQ